MARNSKPALIRSVESLADAKDLRAAISDALADVPINDPTLRAAVWNFVGNERVADVQPAEIIVRLTELIDDAKIDSLPVRQALTRRVILWCVEEYFSHLGGNPLRVGSRPVAEVPHS